eukprot:6692664-Prymnesium_polylepis.2
MVTLLTFAHSGRHSQRLARARSSPGSRAEFLFRFLIETRGVPNAKRESQSVAGVGALGSRRRVTAAASRVGPRGGRPIERRTLASSARWASARVAWVEPAEAAVSKADRTGVCAHIDGRLAGAAARLAKIHSACSAISAPAPLPPMRSLTWTPRLRGSISHGRPARALSSARLRHACESPRSTAPSSEARSPTLNPCRQRERRGWPAREPPPRAQ